jgi:hypothetical protein
MLTSVHEIKRHRARLCHFLITMIFRHADRKMACT